MKSKIKEVQDWRDAQAKQLAEDTKGMTSLDRIHGVLQIHHIEGIIKGLDIALNILNKKPEIKVVGVIAYNIEDFKLWSVAKKHKPKSVNGTQRDYVWRGTRYIALTKPEHVCGFAFDKVIETGSMASLNKLYHSILESARVGLKTQKA